MTRQKPQLNWRVLIGQPLMILGVIIGVGNLLITGFIEQQMFQRGPGADEFQYSLLLGGIPFALGWLIWKSDKLLGLGKPDGRK